MNKDFKIHNSTVKNKLNIPEKLTQQADLFHDDTIPFHAVPILLLMETAMFLISSMSWANFSGFSDWGPSERASIGFW